jgi:hypothetical protein
MTVIPKAQTDAALDIACPTCKADVGDVCPDMKMNGRVYTWPDTCHMARLFPK